MSLSKFKTKPLLVTAEQHIEFNLATVSKTIIPAVLMTVLSWGCLKDGNETFEDYINRIDRVCNKKWIRQYNKSKKLQQTHTHQFVYTKILNVNYLCHR